MTTIFRGTIIHSTSLKSLEILENGWLAVGKNGRIAKLSATPITDTNLTEGAKFVDLAPSQFLMPGFVDTHTHAPQYAFVGTGFGMPLLDWLNTYTFPVEAKFSDTDFARHHYTKAVKRFLKNGSTTVAYYGTIHRDACLVLCDAVQAAGQRALVGKVNMDRNSPDYYRESDAKESLAETRRFVEAVLARNHDRITPCITPRFAITCTSELMRGLGEMAKEYKLPIQTHISENDAEIEFTCSLEPQFDSYTAIYEGHGLLTDRAIMGHGIHLEESELRAFQRTGAAISHCPNSNFSIKSGILNLRRLLDKGIRVGLGTDVAGGSSPSMLDCIRRALDASHAKSFIEKNEPVTLEEMFFLATQGGADTLGLGDQVGNFTSGKRFDALVIDLDVQGSPIDWNSSDSAKDQFQKFLFIGDDRNVRDIFVDGQHVLRDGLSP